VGQPQRRRPAHGFVAALTTDPRLRLLTRNRCGADRVLPRVGPGHGNARASHPQADAIPARRGALRRAPPRQCALRRPDRAAAAGARRGRRRRCRTPTESTRQLVHAQLATLGCAHRRDQRAGAACSRLAIAGRPGATFAAVRIASANRAGAGRARALPRTPLAQGAARLLANTLAAWHPREPRRLDGDGTGGAERARDRRAEPGRAHARTAAGRGPPGRPAGHQRRGRLDFVRDRWSHARPDEEPDPEEWQ
jgi:hypothetical protein